jgi:hypothetical protein
VLLSLGLAVTVIAAAQQWNIPTAPPETHTLDGLLGNWTYVEDLHNPKIPPVKGTWTFARGAEGFMVIDEFRSANDTGGTAMLVETYRAYDPETKIWSFETTLYQSPMIGHHNGEWDAGITRAKDGQIFDEVTKGDVISRARFFNIERESFSCVLETSSDGGRTWGKPINIDAVRAQ